MTAKTVIAGLTLAVMAAGAAQADEGAADPIRVCASTKDAPYSEEGGTGFENRIAAVIAEGGRAPA